MCSLSHSRSTAYQDLFCISALASPLIAQSDPKSIQMINSITRVVCFSGLIINVRFVEFG